MRIEYANESCFISTGSKAFDPNANTLLFLHGSGQSHLTFLQQSRFFANRGWQSLNPDMPGHGHSTGTPLQSIEEMADWYIGLLDTLGIASVTIVGHSQGCLTGLEIAHRYPERVSKLCLLAGALAIPVNDALLDLATTNQSAAYQAMVNWGHGAASHLYDHSWPGLTHIDLGNQIMTQNADTALSADLTACNNYKNGPDAAASITCASLVMIAGKDKMTPAKAGRALAASLQNCEAHILADSGHFLPSERPYEVNRALRDFLA